MASTFVISFVATDRAGDGVFGLSDMGPRHS